MIFTTKKCSCEVKQTHNPLLSQFDYIDQNLEKLLALSINNVKMNSPIHLKKVELYAIISSRQKTVMPILKPL